MRLKLFVLGMSLCLTTLGSVSAQAGNGGPGACLLEEPDGVGVLDGDGLVTLNAVCIDGLDEQTCLLLCQPDGIDPDGGFGQGCSHFTGETCAQQGIDWDGACDGVDSPIGNLCILLDSTNPGDSALICEGKGNGTWLGDGSVCGGVPAMPKSAYAALALILLAGTLTLLTLQSRS